MAAGTTPRTLCTVSEEKKRAPFRVLSPLEFAVLTLEQKQAYLEEALRVGLLEDSERDAVKKKQEAG